jgi:hypothetical protein
MKRNQLVFLFAFFLSVTIYWQQSASAAENLLPKVSFEKVVCDLGNVGQGTKNTCEFRFTNTVRGLLKIGKISRTCGCTVFKFDKKEYPPSETGVPQTPNFAFGAPNGNNKSNLHSRQIHWPHTEKYLHS